MKTILVRAEGLGVSYGSSEPFKDLSLSLFESENVGMIGANGTGKSTLLKVLCDRVEIDSGTVTKRKGLRVAYLLQDTDFKQEATVVSVAKDHAKTDPMFLQESYEIEHILNMFGFQDKLEELAKDLSGGWKKRLALALCWIENPDLLLLDEPTNHLDIDGILSLESLLKASSFSWVAVSHDRYFLNHCVRRVVEVGPQFSEQILETYGSYSQHLIAKENFMNQLSKNLETIDNKLRKETEWAKRQPKARATKSKHRMEGVGHLEDSRMETSAKLKSDNVRLEFEHSGRKTRKLIEMEGLGFSYSKNDAPIVKGLSLVIKSDSRLAVLGPNGSGKTTVLRLLSAELSPTEGKLRHTHQIKLHYFSQIRDQIPLEWSVKRALSETGDQVTFQGRPVHITAWAKRFKINPTDLTKPVSTLSGGERARLYIARLMSTPCDVLVLDEPTNDLDIESLEALEGALREFDGAVIITSHDRALVSNLATEFLGVGELSRVYASFEQWLKAYVKNKKNEEKNEISKSIASAAEKTETDTSKKKKLGYLEQREYDGMEAAILELETQNESLKSQMERPDIASNAEKLNELYLKSSEVQEKIEAMYARWSQLEEKT